MKKSLLVTFLCLWALQSMAAVIYTPSGSSSFLGAGVYCQGATAGPVVFTYNTCNTGTGSPAGTTITASWYNNIYNSTSGGTFVSSSTFSCATSATGNVSFTPPTASTGTTYYYCVITWTGTGTCNTTGSLTSSSALKVTVTLAPTSITGATSVCQGSMSALSNGVAGGTWSSSATSVASVNPASGSVTGITAGAVTISYATGCGSPATGTFTVNAMPAAVSGSSSVCSGTSSSYTSSTSGGTWSSNATTVATVNSATGLVAAVSPGFAVITYSLSSCATYKAVTVTTAPAAISGASSVCSGLTTALSEATGGGSWSVISGSGSASINSSGVVTGINPGVVTTYYTIGSCSASYDITVNNAPAAIVGASSVCEGAITALSNSVSGGIWTTSDTGIATINAATGILTGLTAGYSIITYSIGSCSAFSSVTVNTAPTAIAGAAMLCPGDMSNYFDSLEGGTWSTSDASLATIDLFTGELTALSSGTTTISYTLGTCSSTAGLSVSTPVGLISGSSSICTGVATTLTDSIAGGSWSVSNGTGSATIDAAGNITGVSVGTAVVSYNNGSCRATLEVNINQAPAPIVGTTVLCAGTTSALTDSIAGGLWTSSNASLAIVDPTSGLLTGNIAGLDTVFYTYGTCGVSVAVTVNIAPAAISGPSKICFGTNVSYSDSIGGGTWSLVAGSGTAVLSGSSLSATANGDVNLYYTIGSCQASLNVTITSIPAPITGAANVCETVSTTLSNAVGGGTWVSAAPAVATIDAITGVTTGVTAGAAVISYLSGICSQSYSFTVLPAPVSGSISRTGNVCVGTSISYADAAPGGIWTSSDTTVATVSATGSVTGIAPGLSIIAYTVTNTCGTVFATDTTLVTAQPVSGVISGNNALCTGLPNPLIDTTTGGTWTMSNPHATITGGVVTGISAGADTALYTVSNVCGTSIASFPLNIQTSGVWLGTSSTNWNDAANWPCEVLPDNAVNVTIPAGTLFAPTVPTSTGAFSNNLTLESGAHLTLNTGASIQVAGSFSNSGAIDGAGSVVLNGPSAQTINGSGIVNNLNVNNPNGVAVASRSSATINNTLTITAGNLATNDSIILASDSIHNARITPIPASGASISGNVKIMQYIGGGHRAYRFWAHPYSSYIPLSQLENYIDVTGFGGMANGFTTTGTNAPSVYRYDPTVGNSAMALDPGWKAFTSAYGTADSNRLHRYQGIRLFVRGVKGQGLTYADVPSPVTVATWGPVNQGNQKITLTKGTGANQDYNMIGNPYPSPVDIGIVVNNAKIKGNITGAGFYVWNPYLGIAGQFQAITISATPYYLEANTCFQVRAAHNNDSLNFTEANKSATINTTLLKSVPEGVNLTIYDENYHPYDMLSIKFNSAATDREDDNFDAGKLLGYSGFNFYSLSSDSQKLSIDCRPYRNERIIPLGVASEYMQEYIIKSESVVVPEGGRVYLIDNFLNRTVLLYAGTEYKFSVNDDPKSQGDGRFELKMNENDNIASTNRTDFKVTLTPNPATNDVTISVIGMENQNLKLNITDISGVCVRAREFNASNGGKFDVSLDGFSAGVYMVEISGGGKKLTQRLVKE